MRNLALTFAVLSLLACIPSGDNPVTNLANAPTGRIWFQTQDYSSLWDFLYRSDTEINGGSSLGEFLKHAPPRAARHIYGDLSLPDTSQHRIPVIVLFHGGAGPERASADWYTRRFNEQGWAVFTVNNVAGRGFSRWSREGDRLYSVPGISAAYLADAINALLTMSQHPRIDPKRIAILGQSYGGAASLYSNFENLVSGFLPEGIRYRANASVYGVCFNWIWGARSTGAPVTLHTGEFDDWTGSRPDMCEHHTKYLTQRGFSIDYRLYPGYHGWDQLNSSGTGSLSGNTSAIVRLLPIGHPPPDSFSSSDSAQLQPRTFAERRPQLWIRGDFTLTSRSTTDLVEFFKNAFSQAD